MSDGERWDNRNLFLVTSREDVHLYCATLDTLYMTCKVIWPAGRFNDMHCAN